MDEEEFSHLSGGCVYITALYFISRSTNSSDWAFLAPSLVCRDPSRVVFRDTMWNYGLNPDQLCASTLATLLFLQPNLSFKNKTSKCTSVSEESSCTEKCDPPPQIKWQKKIKKIFLKPIMIQINITSIKIS